MVEQPQHLIASLREGMCVASDRCRVRDAASGCDCAIIADYIEQQAAEIARLQEAKRRALVVADERSKENVELRVIIEKLMPSACQAMSPASPDYNNGKPCGKCRYCIARKVLG